MLTRTIITTTKLTLASAPHALKPKKKAPSKAMWIAMMYAIFSIRSVVIPSIQLTYGMMYSRPNSVNVSGAFPTRF